jgi:DNA-binding transcriptional LysR family regulator
MDRIESMTVFAKVVASRSFSGAARDLRVSQAVVSKHVRSLETWLGARLLNRTTRRVSLTEIGALVYERGRKLLDEVDEIRHEASTFQTSPRGHLRIAAPVSFGVTHLGPALADYLERYPDVSIELCVSDTLVDLVAGGFDMAIRIGQLVDSSLMVRRLARIPFVVCAAPSYLERHGTPQLPEDLSHHQCLCFGHRIPSGEWRLTGPSGEVAVRVSGRITANSGDVLSAVMLAGGGIALAPTFEVADDLKTGRLVRLLPAYAQVGTELSALYPPGRHLSAKMRSLIDFLATRFGGERDWEADEDSADPATDHGPE